MRRVLLWIGGIVGAVVAAVALAVVFFQWNWLRGPLEARLGAVTGKTVRIEGRIQGHFSWVPTVSLEQVVAEEPAWDGNQRVATADRIDISLDLHRLLHGTLDFPVIAIVKPVLTIERRADGRANWDIAAEASGPASRSSVPIIETFSLDDGRLSYRDPAKHVSIDATVATLKAHGGTGGNSIKIEGHGSYQNSPFTLRLEGDPLDLLRGARQPYKVSATADLGRTHIESKGTVGDPIKMTGLALSLHVEGQNAADLYPYFRIPAPPTPPYRLTGTLDRDSKVWIFRDFGGTVGQSDLAGALRFDTAHPRLAITGHLASNTLNLVDLGLIVGAPTKPAAGAAQSEAQKRAAAAYEASDRVLPDAPLNLDEVRSADVDITFKGQKLIAEDLPLQDIDLHVKIDAGILTLDPLRIGVAGGVLQGAIVIDARATPVKTSYDVRFRQFQLADFLARAGHADAGSGTINGRIRLAGSGNSIRKSLGSANGTASLLIDRGTISSLAADLLGLDIARSVGLLLAGDRRVELRCAITHFEVNNGVMTPQAFVIDTAPTLVSASGSINLSDETLHLKVEGKPKRLALALSGPINVGGTFKHPNVGLPKKAYVQGGGALALSALLTPVAAILAFIDPGAGHDADCAGLKAGVAEAQK